MATEVGGGEMCRQGPLIRARPKNSRADPGGSRARETYFRSSIFFQENACNHSSNRDTTILSIARLSCGIGVKERTMLDRWFDRICGSCSGAGCAADNCFDGLVD